MRMMTIFLFICSTIGGCQITKPKDPPVVTPGEDYSAIVVKLAIAHNDARREKGLRALETSPLLTKAAQGHADWMARTGSLSHSGKNGSSFSQRVRDAGYNMRTGGENIARGYSTIDAAMRGWMRSRGHKRNILSADFTEIGIGIAESEGGKKYWCVVFATPRSLESKQQQAPRTYVPDPADAE